MRLIHLLAAGAATIAVAAPAAAQSSYPYQSYPVQQTYPYEQAYPGYGYQQAYPGYGYPQSYGYQQGGTNVVEQIVNSLLGNNNRYTVSDRTAVSRCASAAMSQAQAQYRPGYNRYGYSGYGYNQPYANSGYNNAYSQMHVTAITQVERRSSNSLRVEGLISSGAYAQPYGNAYGYRDQRYSDPRYAQAGDISFRCNVDYRGAVSGVRVGRTNAAYRR